MLFSYLIGTVFKLYGPVTDYWTHSINEHISYEYVITNGDECHIALGITRDDDERSVSWREFPVKDETGGNVTTRRSREDSQSEGFIPTQVIFAGGDLHPGQGTKVAYLMQPKNPRFGFTVDLKIEDENGNLSTETTTVRCDVSQCKCKEDR